MSLLLKQKMKVMQSVVSKHLMDSYVDPLNLILTNVLRMMRRRMMMMILSAILRNMYLLRKKYNLLK